MQLSKVIRSPKATAQMKYRTGSRRYSADYWTKRAGESATAMIVIMAQEGSYVPARNVVFRFFDAIFTWLGFWAVDMVK